MTPRFRALAWSSPLNSRLESNHLFASLLRSPVGGSNLMYPKCNFRFLSFLKPASPLLFQLVTGNSVPPGAQAGEFGMKLDPSFSLVCHPHSAKCSYLSTFEIHTKSNHVLSSPLLSKPRIRNVSPGSLLPCLAARPCLNPPLTLKGNPKPSPRSTQSAL